MLKKISAIVLLYALSTTSVFAKEYVINVHGIVCELCSYGVAKNIRKLDFIDKTLLNNGVKVDIVNQKVFIAVRDDSSLDKEALFKSIKSGGYDPVTIWEIKETGDLEEIK